MERQCKLVELYGQLVTRQMVSGDSIAKSSASLKDLADFDDIQQEIGEVTQCGEQLMKSRFQNG